MRVSISWLRDPAPGFLFNKFLKRPASCIFGDFFLCPLAGLRGVAAATVLALVHHGPYNTLGHSYERLLRQVETEGLGLQLPIREVYLKGPGSPLARGGERFVTEIQIPIG